jgi:hypothetical protein
LEEEEVNGSPDISAPPVLLVDGKVSSKVINTTLPILVYAPPEVL